MPYKDRRKRLEHLRNWKEKNTVRYRSNIKNWKMKNKEENYILNRKSHLKTTYGITPEDYENMLSAQSGVCYICLCNEKKKYKGITKKLSVDHSHATGKIRKLLCSACNTALGQLEENLETILQMVAYIKEHNEP